MEVRQLQIFRTLAEELNFTRAAERVHTVQSNVTAQIKALEEELGAPLFDRLGRKVALTDAGRRFHPFAEQALAAMEKGATRHSERHRGQRPASHRDAGEPADLSHAASDAGFSAALSSCGVAVSTTLGCDSGG